MGVCGCCYKQQGRGDELCVAVQCRAVLWCADAVAVAVAVAVGGLTLRLEVGSG